jgi:hypothetical protein
MGAHGGKRS